MFCCCCSVLSLTCVFAAFELTAYQTTAMWDCEWLAYHDITFFAVHWRRVFQAHIDWIRSTFNQITPIFFAPVHWPLSPCCPPPNFRFLTPPMVVFLFISYIRRPEHHRVLDWQQHLPRPKHSGVREKSSIAMSPRGEKPRIASNLATNLHRVGQFIFLYLH